MCGLFGLIDGQHTLSVKEKNGLLLSLAAASETRGTDATGVAYNDGERLQIYKRPWAGHYMRFRVPANARAVMGHTRFATQGNAKRNCNNHPFAGEIDGRCFALAHNGVLNNDAALRKSLPRTPIETDSYVAVQLIEQSKALNMNSLKSMAERLWGSFTFTILDQADNLYFIKGDNPLCLCFFPARRLFVYSSTEAILLEALSRLNLCLGKPEEINLSDGDILEIRQDGSLLWDKFGLFTFPDPAPWEWPHWDDIDLDYSQIELLKSMASSFGFTPKAVEVLLEKGFTPDEIEEVFYSTSP